MKDQYGKHPPKLDSMTEKVNHMLWSRIPIQGADVQRSVEDIATSFPISLDYATRKVNLVELKLFLAVSKISDNLITISFGQKNFLLTASLGEKR